MTDKIKLDLVEVETLAGADEPEREPPLTDERVDGMRRYLEVDCKLGLRQQRGH